VSLTQPLKEDSMATKRSDHDSTAEKTKTQQATWPDFAVSLYDKLTGRGAEITYEFDDLDIFIPAKLGEEADHFHWKMNGTLHVRTRDHVNKEDNHE